MSQILTAHIARFIKIEESSLTDILNYFDRLNVHKRENLLKEGKVCKSNYFVEKGCLRLFFINEKGVEQTTEFALENWWMSDYTSFTKKTTSEFYIQAVENAEVLALGFDAQEKMLKSFPQMERYFKIMHQRAHAAAQFRIKVLYNLSGEQLYYQFSNAYPEFVQRVPQYLLASFLGITPEYLSEIRKKRIS